MLFLRWGCLDLLVCFLFIVEFWFLFPVAEGAQLDHRHILTYFFESVLNCLLLHVLEFLLVLLSDPNLFVGVFDFVQQAADHFLDVLGLFRLRWFGEVCEPVNFDLVDVGNLVLGCVFWIQLFELVQQDANRLEKLSECNLLTPILVFIQVAVGNHIMDFC